MLACLPATPAAGLPGAEILSAVKLVTKALAPRRVKNVDKLKSEQGCCGAASSPEQAAGAGAGPGAPAGCPTRGHGDTGTRGRV